MGKGEGCILLQTSGRPPCSSSSHPSSQSTTVSLSMSSSLLPPPFGNAQTLLSKFLVCRRSVERANFWFQIIALISERKIEPPPEEEAVNRSRIYCGFTMNFIFCTKRRQKQSFLKQFKKEKLPPLLEELSQTTMTTSSSSSLSSSSSSFSSRSSSFCIVFHFW